MADEHPGGGSSTEGGDVVNTSTGPAVTSSPIRPSTSTQREERDSTPASRRGVEADGPAEPSLQRAGTLPIRRRGVEEENVGPDNSRRRGRTISSKPRNLEAPPLSPRSQIFGRNRLQTWGITTGKEV